MATNGFCLLEKVPRLVCCWLTGILGTVMNLYSEMIEKVRKNI